MSSFADSQGAALWAGTDVRELARRLDVPAVVAFERVASTMDVAHALGADGAPAGTLVLADAQSAGRGRQGRAWSSEPGSGIWLTLIERPSDVAALDVLSIRVGLALAPALETYATGPVRLKWPNDLYVNDKKLAGTLIEARWRGDRVDWVAIGVGINLRLPRAEARAAALRAGVSRVEVLGAIVPRLRAAAMMTGGLTPDERSAFAARDLVAGLRCIEPVAGRVRGIDERGALLVETGSGVVHARAGSLVLQEER